MKYFLHDCNSFNDEKITELFLQYGYEGLGLFYSILEKIGSQEKPIKTNVLKAQLKVGKKLEKCWSFMESLGLISSNNGETFNERILSYSETYQIKKEKSRERVLQFREKQSLAKNVTHYEHVSNAPKVKESKVKESKEGVLPKKEEDFSTITDTESNQAFEFMYRLGRKEITKPDILNFWEIFKIHKPEYSKETRQRQMQHFRDWLKFQKKQDGTNQQSITTGKSGNSKGANQLLASFKSDLSGQ